MNGNKYPVSEVDIGVEDLAYISPDKRYSFQFFYFGQGVFLLKSSGHADEFSIRKQIAVGDQIREWLNKQPIKYGFQLIWDLSELKGFSIVSRRLLLLKATNKGIFGSISAVGSNSLVRMYGKIINRLEPSLNLFFFKTIDEALENAFSQVKKKVITEDSPNLFISPETALFTQFVDLWQKDGEILNINGKSFKVLRSPAWQFESMDQNFRCNCSVIEGNIVYYTIEGFIKKSYLEIVYQIIDAVIDQFSFSVNYKYFIILDLRKVKGITLRARRFVMNIEEEKGYNKIVKLAAVLASPVISFALKVQKKINPQVFTIWHAFSSTEEALNFIQAYPKGDFINQDLIPESKVELKETFVPETKEELKKANERLRQENEKLKKELHANIQKIIEITGRMTWDESLSEDITINIDRNSPFSDIYSALAFLRNDFLEIMQEKTEQTQLLQESEDKYKNLINLANDIIIVYQEGKSKLVNSRVLDIIGYSPEEIMQLPLENLVAPSELPAILNAFSENKTKNTWYIETMLVQKSGQLIPVSVSIGTISYDKLPAYMFIIRDNSKRKAAENELKKYKEHLEELVKERTLQLEKEITERKLAEQSDKLKTAFLSNMSHEIRTPMNAIISFSGFLKDSSLSDQQKEEYLNYIQSSGQSLLNLINDIIDISKIEAKQISIHLTPYPIQTLLEELFVVFEENRKNRGLHNVKLILNKVETNSSLVVLTDPYRLRQILSNLLDNAMKFTSHGSIEFGYKIEKSKLKFYVKDSGIGIPSDKMEFIFKRFGKIESSGRNLSGTGLGLTISSQLATLLNGSLTVESTQGIGSTFWLEIPFEGEQHFSFPEHKEQSLNKTYSWPNKKILVAEDEDLNFKVLSIALSKTEAFLIRAHNGKDAVHLYENNPDIDLVLMDIQMPELNGYEAFVKIKQLNPQLPVIAQTAFALLEEQARCLKAGFNDYISKPINIGELMEKMDKYL